MPPLNTSNTYTSYVHLNTQEKVIAISMHRTETLFKKESKVNLHTYVGGNKGTLAFKKQNLNNLEN